VESSGFMPSLDRGSRLKRSADEVWAALYDQRRRVQGLMEETIIKGPWGISRAIVGKKATSDWLEVFDFSRGKGVWAVTTPKRYSGLVGNRRETGNGSWWPAP